MPPDRPMDLTGKMMMIDLLIFMVLLYEYSKGKPALHLVVIGILLIAANHIALLFVSRRRAGSKN